MKTKHTEGPWHYGEFPLTDSGNVYIWNQAETTLVAEASTEECSKKEAKANAALIAAAPEMLSALESIASFFHKNDESELGIAGVMREVRDAIAKSKDVSQFVDGAGY